MINDKRQTKRYDDFGRVDCDELCIVAGILEDISLKGCKVHFNVPVSFDPENEYELKIRLSRDNLEPLELVCQPQWSKTVDGSTDIGFEFLHSKDSSRLETYINLLKNDEKQNQEIQEIIEDSSCQFI